MNNRKNYGRKHGLQQFLTIFLAGILMLNVLVLMFQISGSKSYNSPYEYSDMIRLVRKKDYPGLLEDIAYNRIREVSPQMDTGELEALASYYQNAFLYHAYKSAGDVVHADETSAVLQKLALKMTEPEILEAAEDIRSRFLS